MIRVSGLFVYPVKSARGIRLDRMAVDRSGPDLDRRFMIVGSDGEFLSQRKEPRLAQLAVEWSEESLRLNAPGMSPMLIPLREEGRGSERVEVQVWRFRGPAEPVSPKVDDWLSEWLGGPWRLVRAAPEMDRLANPEWVDGSVPVAFPDGYPLLLTTEASLAGLNAEVQSAGSEPAPLEMARFRPNLVVSGCEPFAEDDWSRIRVGSLEIDVVKPCDRCSVTTVDPTTGRGRGGGAGWQRGGWGGGHAPPPHRAPSPRGRRGAAAARS
ncbi:MOSC N-terminal beta barrel domain-containing protein, partial [Myxococcota bacterium]|nr:MOSC N-terminal beta barrel domain-containing protein [Myxococcota bacterium]